MALQGTIKDFGLADIFQLISLQKKTGLLILEGKGHTVTIYFQEGNLISADTVNRWERDKLGWVLLRAGKISREQLDRALDIKGGTLHKLGYILIKEGIITKEELSEALQRQMKKLIFNLFHWKEGKYRFIPEKVEYDDDVLIPMDTEYILMEGMRILDEWPSIEKKIPSFDTVLKQVRGKHVDIEEVTALSGDDKTVLKLVDGVSDIGMIIDSSNLGEVDTCKSLIKLIDLRLIEKSIPKAEPIDTKETKVLPAAFSMLDLKLLKDAMPALIFVLVILVVAFGFFNMVSFSLSDTMAVNRIEDLKASVRLYYLDKEEYPSSLKALVKEGYKKNADILDPWGRAYIYEKTEDTYAIYSSGWDGLSGNEDDIK